MKRPSLLITSLCFISLFMSACSSASPTNQPVAAASPTRTSAGATATAVQQAPTATQTSQPSPTLTPSPAFSATPVPTATITPTATLDMRLPASMWRQWPIVPTLSAKALEIYRQGQKLGNDPHSFIRIGDCQSEPEVFLGLYDDPTRYYFDPKYEYLQQTVSQFAGSFARSNVTARRGFGVASVFSPLQNDPKQCSSSETPLDCEYRLHKPIMAFVSMGTNWCKGCTTKFEEYLRKIVDFSIQNGIIPILSTKADNAEGDNSLNEAVARVAYDYDVPMWNFWSAVQYMPNAGLEEDDIYLTVEGWNERSFTGLQTLDTLWTALQAAQ
jgi:hypothetical protein